MFTPEFTSFERGEFVLVANHSLEDHAARQLSVVYNRGRVAFGLARVPPGLSRCRLVYDLRGQKVDRVAIEQIRASFDKHCIVEFML